MAGMEAEVATPKHAQSCFGRLFDEKAFLEKLIMINCETHDFKISLSDIGP